MVPVPVNTWYITSTSYQGSLRGSWLVLTLNKKSSNLIISVFITMPANQGDFSSFKTAIKIEPRPSLNSAQRLAFAFRPQTMIIEGRIGKRLFTGFFFGTLPNNDNQIFSNKHSVDSF